MRDVTPSRGDRSIRNIPVSASHHRHATPHIQEETGEEFIHTPKKPMRPNRFKGVVVWGGVALALCAITAALLSTVFEGATITIYPKTAAVTPSGAILAVPNAPSGQLGYDVLPVTKSASTSVAASGVQHVAKQATGVVTIYNAYSTASQRLIANTRFEASDGKIYRIHDSVVVPGAIKKADGALTPGSVSASVFADSPGPEYNKTGTTAFTIPGFKKDPRYTKFTAQSQGAIAGGFIGDQPSVSPTDLAKAQTDLQQQLNTALQSVLVQSVPQGYTGVNNSVSYTYSDVTQTPGQDNTAVLSQSATASVAIVRIADLASALAKRDVPGYAGEPVDFSTAGGQMIAVGIASSTGKAVTGTLPLIIQGSPVLVWQFDQAALKVALLGKEKAAFESIIKTFQPAVAKAEASVRPFWKGTFPSNADKLSITIKEK